jgi:hypothetical protein
MMIKAFSIQWAGYVARMVEMKNPVGTEKLEWKRLLWGLIYFVFAYLTTLSAAQIV